MWNKSIRNKTARIIAMLCGTDKEYNNQIKLLEIKFQQELSNFQNFELENLSICPLLYSRSSVNYNL